MSNSNSSSSSGTGVLGLLGVVFVTLKLCKVIDWNWWYVTMPFWGGLVLIIVALTVWLIVSIVKTIIKKRKHKYRMSKFE